MEKKKEVTQQPKDYASIQIEELHNMDVLANNEQGGFVILQEVKHPDQRNFARVFVVYKIKGRFGERIICQKLQLEDHMAYLKRGK